MATSEGGFVWYELMTSDLEASQAFYAKVVGWGMTDSGVPGMRYTLATVGEHRVAGLMGFPPDRAPGPNMWFGYVLVADVDAAAERVRQAGGTVHRAPMDIPGVGRFAAVADPQGAMFMLFHGSGDAPPALAPNSVGSIGWHELRTRDWASAFAFYQDLFGWQKSYAHDMGPMGVYQTFSVAGVWTGGMMSSPQAPAPHWSYYINVEDIDAAAARVVEAGGQVLNGPHSVPGDSWVLTAADPQGGAFALVSQARAHAVAAPPEEPAPTIDEPAVVMLERQDAAVIRIVVPRRDMPTVMRPAIAELTEALRAQRIAPAGALFAHHLRMSEDVFDVEVGFPTARAVAAAGRVQPGTLPAGRVARATYRGGYDGLAAAWGAFRRWIGSNGYQGAADLWEVYAAGPSASADPAQWRTELNQPLRG